MPSLHRRRFAGICRRSSAIVLVPTTVEVSSGSDQRARVSLAFSAALVALVRDQFGHAMVGVTVNFTKPSSGSSCTLSAASAVTDADGKATITATANGVSGSYNTTATVTGIDAVQFALTNWVYPTTAAEALVALGSPAGWTAANILNIYPLDAASGNETDLLGVGPALVPGGGISQNQTFADLPGSKKGVIMHTNSTDKLQPASDATWLDVNGTIRSALLVAAMASDATVGNLNVMNKFMGGAGWIWRANPVGQIDIVFYPDGALSGVDTGSYHNDTWHAYGLNMDDVTKHVQMITEWGAGTNQAYTNSPHTAGATTSFGAQNGNAQSHRFAFLMICDKPLTQAMLSTFMAPLLA